MRICFLLLFCSCVTQYKVEDEVILKSGEKGKIVDVMDNKIYYVRTNAFNYQQGFGIWRSDYQLLNADQIERKVR